MSLFGSTDAVVLALPVLFGAAGVGVVWWAAPMFGRPEAAVAALLTALSPELLEYSSQVRPYSLLQLLVPLSCYFLWAIRSGRGKRSFGFWAGYVLCSIDGVHPQLVLPCRGRAICLLWRKPRVCAVGSD